MRTRSLASVLLVISVAMAGSAVHASNPNGSAGAMPAFYDGHRFLINFKELPPAAEQSVLARNASINRIFMSDPGLPGGEPFVSVLDAIQGDGFNPLWQEFQIAFTPGHVPRQLVRDDDILEAAQSGEITLSATDEVYRCAVIGAKAADHTANPNGSGGDMPAFYDGDLFTINFKELPAAGEAAVLAGNKSINTIFMSDPGLPGGEPFVSVLDAIQGDGFNPLWLEVQVAFTAGHTPRQLVRDDDILDAAAAGEVTLSATSEVYRCAVIGPK